MTTVRERQRTWSCLKDRPAPCGYSLRKLACGWWYHDSRDEGPECHDDKHRQRWLAAKREKEREEE